MLCALISTSTPKNIICTPHRIQMSLTWPPRHSCWKWCNKQVFVSHGTQETISSRKKQKSELSENCGIYAKNRVFTTATARFAIYWEWLETTCSELCPLRRYMQWCSTTHDRMRILGWECSDSWKLSQLVSGKISEIKNTYNGHMGPQAEHTDEEEMFMDPEWEHLHLVYEILLRIVSFDTAWARATPA